MDGDHGQCPSWQQLRDFHRGDVNEDCCDRIGEHLCECTDCLNRVETLEASHDTLQRPDVDDQPHANSATGNGGAEAEHWFDAWRKFLDEAELIQLCQNAMNMVAHESSAAWRMHSPDDLTAGNSSQSNFTTPLRDTTAKSPAKAEQTRTMVGNYLIVRQLGHGAFSSVYLAEHRGSGRQVALKVPRENKPLTEAALATYLDEARKLSLLRHPSIVRVQDWGELKHQQFFVASDWIDGLNLRERIQLGTTDRDELLDILRQIADGLQHAHQCGLVHRDVKPANILVDCEGSAYLVDFGLAIRDDEQWKLRGQLAGTRPYMSPEQLRGETHRLDGRTDVWAMGVILYELLAGQRPFHGREVAQLIDEIDNRDPKPLRQIDQSVPVELERICMKCLQKRMTDRYATAADLSADLGRFLDSRLKQATFRNAGHPDEGSETFSPPGVRSFEMSDADVFCSLLPGLRGADGIPESVAFLSNKLSCQERDATFPIGVIYGPSGCGKSSFVKAGVLPRLASSTHVVVLEATRHDFDSRLRDALYNALPDVVPEMDCAQLPLPELFDCVRRCMAMRNQKLVVVVDHLEQWLSVWDDKASNPFVSALLHCDGAALQTLLIVRDDFWLATSRLMQKLEQPLIDGENALFMDLFLVHHAEKVLQKFGRAYRALPAGPTPLNRNQSDFLSQAIGGLSRNGRVAPVQVAFVAEILKDEEWEPRTLELYGGIEGIGVRFLERTFTLPTAPATHRSHAKAAQAVLRLLLPAAGVEGRATLKGQSRSEKELSMASGIPLESSEFQDLLQLLDAKTKLISAVDPVRQDDSQSSSGPDRRYQLAHDYLVPSLQEWLARTEAFTWGGRTRQMLRRLNDMWSNYEDTRHLPRLIEWLQIRALIPVSEWTISQTRMMRQAQGRFIRRGIIAACMFVLLFFVSWQYVQSTRATSLLNSFLHAPSNDVAHLIEEVDSSHRWSHPQLKEILADAERDNNLNSQRRALMALVRRDLRYAPALIEHYREAPVDELALIREALSQVPDAKIDLNRLWQDLESPETPSSERIRLAVLLAHRSPSSGNWSRLAGDIAALLIGQPPAEHKQWAALVQPVAQYVLVELAEKAAESPSGTSLRIPASLYIELAQTSPNGYQPIAEVFDSAMNADLGRSVDPARRAAAAAALLASHGRWDAVEVVFQHTEDPTFRSYLIEYLVESAISFESLVEQLGSSRDASTRQALILTIGDAGRSRSRRARAPAVRVLLDVWRTSGSPGIRHSVSWVLREWDVASDGFPNPAQWATTWACPETAWNALSGTDLLADFPVSGTISSHRLEIPMVCFSAGDMNRVDELGREIRATIARPFAIGTTEVTVEDFLRFREHHVWDERKSPKFDCPVNLVSWYDAVAYCNWLSEMCGIPEEEWCYMPNASGEYSEGMKIPDDALERLGFRLATAAEWEFACRGSAKTTWSFGNDPELAPQYAWYQANAGYRTHSAGRLMPNERGLFDMHGNVWEWCHDRLTSSEFREPFELGDCRLCGGTYIDGPRELSFYAHNWNPPDKMTDADGFRICRTLPSPTDGSTR